MFFGICSINNVVWAEGNSDIVYPYHRVVTNSLFYGYQKIISPINQSSCSMSPTCSVYAKRSFRNDNFFKAWLKTSDRLIRCSNDPGNYKRTLVDGMIRFYDPVNTKSNNYTLNLEKNNFGTFNDYIVEDNLDNENAKLLYEFAKELKYSGEIDKAIIEYKRLISYYPDSKYKIKSLKEVFALLYSQNQYLEAIEWGKKMIQNNSNKIDVNKVNFNISTSYFRIGNYKKAKIYFKKVRKSKNKELIDKTYLLEGLSFVRKEEWERAAEIFSKIKSSSKYYLKAQELMKLSEKGTKLKLKDPELAGLLSVIPGLGYLYNGYNQTALSSFFVNSLFIWAIHQSFEEENEGLGTLLGVFTFGFYSGNIYGSIQTANRKNEMIKQNHIYKFNLGFKF